MIPAAPRPGVPQLQRFLQGKLSAEEAAVIESFLLRDEDSLAQLAVANEQDSFVELIRSQRSTEEPVDQEAIGALMAKLLQVPVYAKSQMREMEELPTVPHTEANLKGEASLEATSEVFDFLSPPQAPGELGRLGDYRVLRVLGTGGMGVVFEAEDVGLRRMVALKAMRKGIAMTPQARERFLLEARSTALLTHDHIVTIHQVSEDRGVPFLAMQLLRGESLEDRLKRGEPISLAETLRIGRETALGLAAAHERGLIHRDIKPANLWLDETANDRIKVLDFGLARIIEGADANLTQSGSVMGTPAYMAPEQARGETVDQRCDLYSLGCLLYRLTTGQTPFQGADSIAVILAAATRTPIAATELNPTLPPALSALIQRLMSKNPQERPSSAKDVVAELANIERDLAQLAPSTATAAPPNARRRRKLIVALALVGLTMLAGGIILHITSKDGTTRDIELKPGDKIEIVEKDKEDKKPSPRPAGKGLDHLDPAKIPAAERFVWQPKELVAVIGEHRGRDWGQVRQVIYRPDGKSMATATQVGVSLWDPQTLRQQAFLPAWDSSVAFSLDSKMLAVGSSVDNVRLWDVNGGVPKVQAVIPIRSTSLAFSPDGKTLACGGEDRTVHLWDVTPEKPKERTVLKGHTSRVRAVAFAPDGKTLASLAEEKAFRLWDLRGDEGKEKSVTKVESGVIGVVFSPDGKTLASSEGGRPLVRLWDVTGAEPKERTVIQWHDNVSICSLAFSPDGKALACCTWRARVHLFDLTGMEARERAVLRLTTDDELVAFAPDGKSLVTVGGSNGVLRLWDLSGAEPQERLEPQGHRGRVSGIAASPDSKTLISSCIAEGRIRLWDLTGGAPRQRAENNPPLGPDAGFALSPDGKLLASLDRERAQVWDISGAEPEERASFKGQFRHTPAWSPDGKTLAVYSNALEKPTVHLLDLTGADLKEQAALKGCSTPMLFAPDGKTFFCANSDRGTGAYTSVWDLTAAEPKERAPMKADEVNPTFPAAISPDGTLLLTYGLGFNAHKLVLWKLGGPKPRPREILEIDNTHDPIRGAAFAPDGKTFVIAYHGNVALWDVSRTVSKLKRRWKFPGNVNCVNFLPDGRHLAIGNANGTIYILRLPSRSESRSGK